MMKLRTFLLLTAAATAAAGCGDDDDGDDRDDGPPIDAAVDSGTDPDASATCPGGDPQIQVPAGFCARVFADTGGRPRQLVVTSGNTVVVAMARSRDGLVPGHVLALRDTNADGASDAMGMFGAPGGTGVAWREGQLYVGEDERVVRYPFAADATMPTGNPTVIVGGLPASGDHAAKAIQLDGEGQLLVSIGSETNACQEVNRATGSPGKDPCPELATRAGLWQFNPNIPNQTQMTGLRIATGVRNPTSFAVHPTTGDIVTANNGRDQLHENWPSLYTLEDDKVLPSEELAVINPGTDRGWPYCYHDPRDNEMKLAPEYGGDGEMQGRCATIPPPLRALPAHWASLGMVFYTAEAFPAAYRGGAFIGFHGSRFDPLAMTEIPGYEVDYVPFTTAPLAAGERQPFATGFAGADRPLPDAADHRPVGVAVGPDGALYITDDHAGRIWRVTYEP